MKIRDILGSKGREVVTVSPEETVLDAVCTLVGHRIGAVVVVQEEEILGILSERDVLRLTARSPDQLRTTPVRELMTTELVVGVEDDSLDYVMGIMTRNRVRHLPVVEERRLVGIVSIGDVVNAMRREVEGENRHLKDYIQGAAF